MSENLLPSTPSATTPQPILGSGGTAIEPQGMLGSAGSPVATGGAIPAPVPQTATVNVMRVTGTSDPDCNGDYYKVGETEAMPGFPVYTLNNVPWDQYGAFSRIGFNGIAWVLEHYSEFGEIDGIWLSNDSPYPLTPDLASAWTPDGSENGYPVVVADTEVVEVEPAGPAPILGAVGNAVTPQSVMGSGGSAIAPGGVMSSSTPTASAPGSAITDGGSATTPEAVMGSTSVAVTPLPVIPAQQVGVPGNMPSSWTGIIGPAGTITIGTVSTGAPGSAASVVNVGTPNAAILNITLPAGLPGTDANVTSANVNAAITANPAATRAAMQLDSLGSQLQEAFYMLQAPMSDLAVYTPNGGFAGAGDVVQAATLTANIRAVIRRYHEVTNAIGLTGAANAVVPMWLSSAGTLLLGSGGNGANARCGVGMPQGTSAPAANQAPTSGRGFGWEMTLDETVTPAKYLFCLWAHNGTSLVKSDPRETGVTTVGIGCWYNVIVRLRADGVVEAYTWFGPQNSVNENAVPPSTPTDTLPGGPTSGVFANQGTCQWIAATHSTNAPTGSNAVNFRIYSRKLILG